MLNKIKDTFKVEYNKVTLFNKWIIVLEHASHKEAKKYVKKQTGFMGRSKNRYRIIKE